MAPRNQQFPLLAGVPDNSGTRQEITNPYDNNHVGSCGQASREVVVRAVELAAGCTSEAARLPSRLRAEAIDLVRSRVFDQREQLARLLAAEAGKPIKQARVEIDRTLFVLAVGAEEAGRIGGEVMPLDRMAHGDGRWAITRQFPLSVISGIVPFNFPLLLAAHKLAPAMACGASIVIKPPPQDPLSLMKMGELFQDCGYPEGALNFVPTTVENAAPLIEHPAVRMISFTGSAKAGWAIRKQADRKRVALELGGNAGVIVHSDADIEYAVERCATGGFGYAGQSCISVQRIYVHSSVFDRFVAGITDRASSLKTGDPLDEGTDVGPLIDENNAKRAESWIGEAVENGAELHTGGSREGAVIEPAVLTSTDMSMKINCEEVFAPVVTVTPYDEFPEALESVNDSNYGLQAGLFTNDLRLAWHAFETLDVGGIALNDISGFRVDHMPYGGAKDSGIGREGVKYAIEEMTEKRLLMINPAG